MHTFTDAIATGVEFFVETVLLTGMLALPSILATRTSRRPLDDPHSRLESWYPEGDRRHMTVTMRRLHAASALCALALVTALLTTPLHTMKLVWVPLSCGVAAGWLAALTQLISRGLDKLSKLRS